LREAGGVKNYLLYPLSSEPLNLYIFIRNTGRVAFIFSRNTNSSTFSNALLYFVCSLSLFVTIFYCSPISSNKSRSGAFSQGAIDILRDIVSARMSLLTLFGWQLFFIFYHRKLV